MNRVSEREKTRETSLDRAKSVFYFLTTGFIPLLRRFSRYKMLTHAYTRLVLHHFVFKEKQDVFCFLIFIVNLST